MAPICLLALRQLATLFTLYFMISLSISIYTIFQYMPLPLSYLTQTPKGCRKRARYFFTFLLHTIAPICLLFFAGEKFQD